MNLTLYRQFFRAVPGYEDLFDWCLYLLDCARNQEVYEHAVSFSSLNLVKDGDYYTGTTTVTLINCGGGYTIDKSGLPEGAIVDGYTGDTGDVLTIRIPTRYAGASYTLSATGIDNQTEASLIYYAPDNWNEQRVVTYVYNIEVKAAVASLEVSLPDKPKDGKLIIRKYDAETDEPIAGVSFGYGGSSGDQIAGAVTDSTGTVIFTDIPAGEYFFQEISAPGLYVVDTTRRTFIIRAGEELSFDVYNTRKTGSITVRKQDAYGNALAGAMFALERSEDDGTTWKQIAEQTSAEDGAAVFSGLNVSGIYRVTETKAPMGHMLQAGILFEGKLEDSDSFGISFTSCDCTIAALPFTGQTGFFYIPAILLMLCMGFFIAYKPKKEKTE